MSVNNAPIYTGTPQIGWGTTALATANTAKDGTGTVLGVFTAGANGGYVEQIVLRSAGTNIATVARIFINNGSTNATPGNNILYTEISLAATTLSETTALQPYVIPMNIAIPPGYVINVTLGTTVAAGYYVSTIGGSYVAQS